MFKWLCENFKDFVIEDKSQKEITVNYSFTNKFLTHKTIELKKSDNDNKYEFTIPKSKIMSQLIALNSSSFLVDKNPNKNSKKEIYIIQCNKTIKSICSPHEVIFILDVSGSMKDQIDNLKKYFLETIVKIKNILKKDEKINIKRVLFSRKYKESKYSITKGYNISEKIVEDISSHGVTDFSVFKNYLTSKRKSPSTVIAFTDGKHGGTNVFTKFDDVLKGIKDKVKNEEPNNFIICAMGPEASTKIEKIADAVSGKSFKSDNIEEFFTSITKNISNVMTPKRIYEIFSESIKNQEFVFENFEFVNDVPGIHKVIVDNNSKIKLKN